jgi:hypothetical protein
MRGDGLLDVHVLLREGGEARWRTDLNIDNGSNDLSDLSYTGCHGRAAEGTGSACSLIIEWGYGRE